MFSADLLQGNKIECQFYTLKTKLIQCHFMNMQLLVNNNNLEIFYLLFITPIFC